MEYFNYEWKARLCHFPLGVEGREDTTESEGKEFMKIYEEKKSTELYSFNHSSI